MELTLQNQYGLITINYEVIARIAGLAAMDCYGIVGMAAKNVKDGFVQLLRKESLTKGVRIFTDEDNINIDLHIIVEYGTKISAIADSLIENVKYHVEGNTGLNVGTVNIFVEGVRVNS